MSGGPERYMFSVIELLKKNGHKVIPLTLKLSKNNFSEYSHYFLPPVFGDQISHFKDAKLSFFDKLRLLSTAMYSLTALRRVREVVKREAIDVVYLLNICNYISPSVIQGAKDAGASVVMRLSDPNFICASYIHFREGQVCFKCQQDGVINALRHRCVRGSLSLTLARALTIKFHQLIGIYKKVDGFVAPSRFLVKSLIDAGLPKERIFYVPSFVDLNLYEPQFKIGKYVLYFGRLSEEKGVEVLLNAWSTFGVKGPPLLIVGNGEDKNKLLQIRNQLGLKNVEFKNFVNQKELIDIIKKCAFVVIPSLCHDNSPMVAYETMACGKPLIASKLGGLADQVENNVSGFLVSPGEPEELARAVQKLWTNPELIRRFGMSARERMEVLFSPDNHLRSLEKIFNRCVSKLGVI
jgi:glycosyltransferase involved in cell wall biosynthesis